MGDSMQMGMSGDWVASLDALASGVKEHVLRSAGNAASEVFHDEAKARAPVYAGPAIKRKSGGTIRPGQLRDAIYRAYSPEASGDALKVYRVSWNHTKAPHGGWMEFGNSRHAAHPYIRPAYESAKDRAGQVAVVRIRERTAEVLAELRK